MKFKDQDCITDAFVLPGGEETLLGSIPMEAMDLAIVPPTQSLEYNPANPDDHKYFLKELI